MRLKNITYFACAAALSLSLNSCGDFLDRPVEDNYNIDNFYASDAACVSGVNYLYNSPWYDFQRGFIKMGEVMSGNMYWGSSPYLNFSVNGTDQDLVNMSYSLWATIGHANTVYQALAKASASEATIKQCQGECLIWKAMAYFYLVRSFGDVPIIHNTSEVLASGEYKTCSKVAKADVYEYIIMTLEKAMELLPKQKLTNGHMDYYCAEGLLAKVCLTKAGVTGTLNKDDLQKAVDYAKDVIDNSGRQLMPNYEDIFRGSNNVSDESLIAWRWTVGAQWTSQNTLQSDLMPEGFDENGDCWGGWGGPSVDLMEAFGVKPTDAPNDRIDVDIRRKATIMMPGDVYPYFWRDHSLGNGQSGFEILHFYFDKNYNPAATETFQGPCGAQNVKHAYGNNNDHVAELGIAPARMAYAVATHILRLADVYLVLSEAQTLIDGGQTTNAKALETFNAVRGRAISGYTPKTSITFDDVWKERRLEFAGEGDRWYDFVRRAYYEPSKCIDELKAQKRNAWWNLSDVYKTYFNTGVWDASGSEYDSGTPAPMVTEKTFTIPFPTEDVSVNPNLGSNVEPVHVDVRATYSY